jgi:hypothetical protein
LSLFQKELSLNESSFASFLSRKEEKKKKERWQKKTQHKLSLTKAP